MTKANRVQPVDTLGWDTVYAAPFPVVNSAIMADKTYPASFNYTDVTGVVIDGTWASWQLVQGGSGSNVQMECVVEKGTISGLSQPDGDLTGSTIIIQVNLTQVEDASKAFSDKTAKKGTGSAVVLVTDDKGEGADPAVSVIATSQYPHVTSQLFLDLINTVFGKYFCGNISDFTHVFSIMMLNEEADNGSFSWLKPSAYTYAVGEPVGANIDDCVFGLLCKVDGGKILPTDQQAVDIDALQNLPTGANSAFLISAEKLTEHMLLNGAINTIQGSNANDFTIGVDGVSISNNSDIIWGNFKTKDGVISPKIGKGNFTLSVEEDHILLEMVDVVYTPTAGFIMTMSITQKFGYKTVKREDGKYVFIPDDNTFGSPHIVSQVSMTEGMKIAEVTLAVCGAVAGLACGVSAIGSAIAKAAQAGVDAGVATVEVSAEVIANATANEAEAVADAQSAAAASVDATLGAGAGAVQNGSFLLSSSFRMFAGIAAAMAGVAAAGIAVAGYVIGKEYDKIPAFDDFSANCVGTTKWPNMKDAELVSADLRRSLVIAVKLDQE